MTRIGIFGGSFDPVHQGHWLIVSKLLEQKLVDRVILLPAYRNPLKRGEPGLPKSLRWKMLEAAFLGMPQVELSDWEMKRPQASYSIESLIHFQELFPQASFSLILGQDAYGMFDQWYKAEEILTRANLLVFPRSGAAAPPSPLPRQHEKVTLLDLSIPPLSSTLIRNTPLEQLKQNQWLPQGCFELWQAHLTQPQANEHDE